MLSLNLLAVIFMALVLGLLYKDVEQTISGLLDRQGLFFFSAAFFFFTAQVRCDGLTASPTTLAAPVGAMVPWCMRMRAETPGTKAAALGGLPITSDQVHACAPTSQLSTADGLSVPSSRGCLTHRLPWLCRPQSASATSERRAGAAT